MAGTLSVSVDSVIQGFGANFNGSGGLYAQLDNRQPASLSMTGAGQLSAGTKAQMLTAPNLGGAGQLSVPLYQNYIVNDYQGSVGTLALALKVLMKPAFASAGSLAATAAFPTHAPDLQWFDVAGAYSYTIPWWARVIDVILLGGGGGGKGMALFDAWTEGGEAGAWSTVQWVRGVDMAWSVQNVTGVVGAGGNAGAGGGHNGGTGGLSSAIADSGPSASAAGGPGGNQSNLDTPGKSPGTVIWDGQSYSGGAQQNSQSSDGNGPGGGGAGARVSLAHGGDGAPGKVWFYAYQ